MFQITPQMKIFVALEPVDFRKQIDGLASVCRNILDMDPLSGALFLFHNRKRTSIKMLSYDGQGFCLMIKRLSKGTFKWWPVKNSLDAWELQTLIWNGNPKGAKFSEPWKKI